MKLRNTTKVPDSLLREVIRFVCPASVTNYSIWFKNYRPTRREETIGFCGRAYCGDAHVVCRIPRYVRFKRPYLGASDYTKGRGYRPWNALTYEEALVALVAHELNHLHQAKNPRLYRRTWSARGQYSEVDCDTYALKMIRAWRAKHGLATNAAASLPRRDPNKPKLLTPRQRLEALATPHGITVEYGSPSPDCIWVAPPDSLCDEHGEMPNDPYADEHTHYDYRSAKEAIETYAKMALSRGNTPAAPRVDSPVDAIVMDKASEPAKVMA